MKKKMSMLLGITCLVGLMTGGAQAFDWFGGRLSVGGGFGRVKPKLPLTYQDQYQDGEFWTGNLKYFINNDFSVIASYADLEPYRRGDHDDSYRFRPIMGSIRYNVFHHLPFTPYITLGAGYSTNSHQIPGAQTIKWDGLALQGGLGAEFFITEGASLGVEALFHDFAGEGNNVPYRMGSVAGMMNIYFGAGPSQKRSEEALEKEKAAAAAAAAQAALLAQQQAAANAQAQSDAAKAQAAAAAAQADADKKQQELQAQVTAAQAEMDAIKQMVARKDLAPVNFKTGSADLLVESHAALDKVAESAKKYPNLKLRVEGHTDSTGTAAKNQTLSQKRADAVRDYLTTTAGVSSDQITSVGFGQTHPIASNDTASGRAQNRRVEFIFFLK